MVLFGDFCWHTLALVAALLTTGTVSTTAFHQQTQRPEDGVRPFQLLPQRHREVARGATVQPCLLLQEVQIHHCKETGKMPLASPAIQVPLRQINFSGAEPVGKVRFCAGSAQKYSAAVP